MQKVGRGHTVICMPFFLCLEINHVGCSRARSLNELGLMQSSTIVPCTLLNKNDSYIIDVTDTYQKGEFTLKKYKAIFMMLAIALILTACGGKESKEDVINTIEENIDEVEKYYTEMKLDVKVSNDSDEVIDENKGVLKVSMNENTLESSGEMLENSEVLKYYSTGDATYAQVNDDGWEDMTAQEDDFKHTETNYKSVAQIVMDLKDEDAVEMEEKDGKFIFSFKGKSEEVYQALEEPYSLALAGADINKIKHNLTITVDSETYFIEQLKTEMSVALEGEKIDIKIDHTYGKINEIDDIEIPQEVIDEAEEVTNSIFDKDEDKDENEDKNKEENATGSDEEETRVFEMDQAGIVTTMTYYYKGDEVTKQATKNIIDYEGIGLSSKEEAQELFDPEIAKMQGIDGVSQEMEYSDTEAIESLVIDYEILDFDQAKDMPGLELSGNYENGISMEASAQMLLEQGFEER